MANYATLKAAINAVIKANGQREITGTVLNQTLNAMVNSLGANYQLAGVATPSTNPGTPDQNVFYLAFEAGTYTNFNATVLSAGISILMWNGSWSSQTFYTIDAAPTISSNNLVSSGAVFDAIKTDGSAYDVSAHFPTGGPNNDGKFTLNYILTNANTLIPEAWRKGGMSIRFISSFDNKYVQYRLMADEWSTVVTDWQGVVDEPVAGSKDLTTSGGLYNTDLKINSLLVNVGEKYSGESSVHQSANKLCILNLKKGVNYTFSFFFDVAIQTASYISLNKNSDDSQLIGHTVNIGATEEQISYTPSSDIKVYARFYNSSSSTTSVTYTVESDICSVSKLDKEFNSLELIDDTDVEKQESEKKIALRKNKGTSANPNYEILSHLKMQSATETKAGLLASNDKKFIISQEVLNEKFEDTYTLGLTANKLLYLHLRTNIEYNIQLTLNNAATVASALSINKASDDSAIISTTVAVGQTVAILNYVSLIEQDVYIRFYNSSSNVTSCNIEIATDAIAIANEVKDVVDIDILNNIIITSDYGYWNKNTGNWAAGGSSLSYYTKIIKCKTGDKFLYKGQGVQSTASVLYYNIGTGALISSSQIESVENFTELSISQDCYVRFASYRYPLYIQKEGTVSSRVEKNEEDISLLQREVFKDTDEHVILRSNVSLTSASNTLTTQVLLKGTEYKIVVTLNASATTASYLGLKDMADNLLVGKNINIGDSEIELSYTPMESVEAYFYVYNNSSPTVTSCDIILYARNITETSIGNTLYGKKITLNGDSICFGAGYIGGYGKIISARNNMEYQNIAISGATIVGDTYSGEGTSNPRHWICRTIQNMDSDADFALLEGGVNDASLNIPLGSLSSGYSDLLDDTTFYGAVESSLKQLITRFSGKKIGFIIVHQMTPNYRHSNPENTSYYWAIVKCCNKWGVPYCDLNVEVPPFNYFRDDANLDAIRVAYTNNGDGWHPNEAGYKKYYCDKIEAWMKTL